MGFVKGQSGNPVGRPKGQSNKYTKIREAFFCVFKERGKEGLREFAGKDPTGFYKVCATLLPKMIDADVNVHSHEESIEDLE